MLDEKCIELIRAKTVKNEMIVMDDILKQLTDYVKTDGKEIYQKFEDSVREKMLADQDYKKYIDLKDPYQLKK